VTTLKTAPVARRAAAASEPRPSLVWRIVTPARVVLLLAVAVWASALPHVASATVSIYGLLFAGVPGLAAGGVLAALALVLAVRRSSAVDAALAVGVIVLVGRVTATVAVNEPGSTFIFRHLGVIDYIQQYGELSHGTDIYNGWPGAFAAVAWFSDVTGVSPHLIAVWFPGLCDVAFAWAVFLLCRAFGQRVLVAVVGAFIATVVNWVGQDYLSPQAFGILLATLILTLLVQSKKHPAAGWLTLPLFLALTLTHQLTPYWLVIITVVLGVTGHIRPRLIGLIFIAIVGVDLLVNIDQVSGQGVLSNFDPIANSKSLANGSVYSDGATFTALSSRIPSVALWGSAALIAAASLFWKPMRGLGPIWVPAVFAFSSFSLLFTQNYGGEAIFRVFLYSIPGCAVLIAPWLVRAIQVSPATVANRWLRRAIPPLTAIALIVITLGSLQAYYGAWFANLVRTDSVTAVENWLETTEGPAQLLSPTIGVPLRPVAEYVDFAEIDSHYDASLTTWNGWAGSSFKSTEVVDTFTRQLADLRTDTYVMVTTQTKIYSDFYGAYPAGALDRLSDQLRVKEGWTTLIDTPDLQLFEYTGGHR
jgi:hypothetical protein